MMKKFFRKRRLPGTRAQAMVEFAIALPVLLMMLMGIMEVGRMAFIYALVVNSSRDAVRYASAVGRSDYSGNPIKYNDCTGIIAVAKQSAYIVPITITAADISYDTGPGIPPFATCSSTVTVKSGNRVTVTVHATYSPIVKLLPISSRTFSATSSRTILGILKLGN